MIEVERREGAPAIPVVTERRARQRLPARSPEELLALARRSLFVDNARFWSMAAVVALHCVWPAQAGIGGAKAPWVLLLIYNSIKFGTIGFFLISGFLLGESFEKGSPATFLRRRLEKIALPWLAWFVLMIGWEVARRTLHGDLNLVVNRPAVHLIAQESVNVLTGSAFWFVPNLLLSLCLLLALRRYLRSLWLGGALFAITSFYAANVYMGWLHIGHTCALGGFVFFLWLGAWISRHYERLSAIIGRVPLPLLAMTVLTFLGLSLQESDFLTLHGSTDPFDTLRPGNQLYSVGMMLLIMRLRRATWPAFVNARTHMFGVYLTHTLIRAVMLLIFYRLYRLVPHTMLPSYHLPEALACAAALFIGVACVSVGLTRFLSSHSRMAWLVGDLSHAAKPKEARQPKEASLPNEASLPPARGWTSAAEAAPAIVEGVALR